jgi:hypothetical protein
LSDNCSGSAFSAFHCTAVIVLCCQGVNSISKLESRNVDCVVMAHYSYHVLYKSIAWFKSYMKENGKPSRLSLQS